MKIALISLIIILSVAILLYRSCAPRGDLNVDPRSRKEIEKAKQR